ncbi:MAG TPA: hypothetical protein VFY22_05010 [Hydrogenophaga sp.]|nr:hypothetical protein [Hydrogenophaga sp.]
MNTENFGDEEARHMGKSATDPIELPAHPMTAHSGPSNCRF